MSGGGGSRPVSPTKPYSPVDGQVGSAASREQGELTASVLLQGARSNCQQTLTFPFNAYFPPVSVVDTAHVLDKKW